MWRLVIKVGSSYYQGNVKGIQKVKVRSSNLQNDVMWRLVIKVGWSSLWTNVRSSNLKSDIGSFKNSPTSANHWRHKLKLEILQIFGQSRLLRRSDFHQISVILGRVQPWSPLVPQQYCFHPKTFPSRRQLLRELKLLRRTTSYLERRWMTVLLVIGSRPVFFRYQTLISGFRIILCGKRYKWRIGNHNCCAD